MQRISGIFFVCESEANRNVGRINSRCQNFESDNRRECADIGNQRFDKNAAPALRSKADGEQQCREKRHGYDRDQMRALKVNRHLGDSPIILLINLSVFRTVPEANPTKKPFSRHIQGGQWLSDQINLELGNLFP
jgi:hypothetical protein